jgi:hypothetical protein
VTIIEPAQRQIKQKKNSTNTQKQNTKRTKLKQNYRKKEYKSINARTLYPEKTQIINNVTD